MTESKLFDIRIDEPSAPIYSRAKEKFDSLAKPVDGLGRFEDIICRIAAIRGSVMPDISNKCLVIMCSDNGVVDEGISQTDRSVTAEVAALMGKNKSSVGAMTSSYPVKIIPVDIGIDCNERIEGVLDRKIARGTGNISKEPAMTSRQCLDAIQTGIDMAVSCACQGFDIIATGEMGIGNTTSSTALFCALTGTDVKSVTGRGAGLSDEGLKRKTQVIESALKFHGLDSCPGKPDREYAFAALAKVGGLDLAGLAGVFIGGAQNHVPVVIDGAVSAVAALAAYYIAPGCEKYMIASHKGREAATAALSVMGLFPVIDADMALGEGTGAVLLFTMLDMIMSVYRDGTRFEETDIDRYERFNV